jgi:hypothetical protein
VSEMKPSALRGFALGVCVAEAWLAGCGGSQPPISTPVAMPQSRAIAARAYRGGSWIAASRSRDNLLYVANDWYYTGVTIYNLGSGNLVGRLTGFVSPVGLCSDSSGDVYVVDVGQFRVFEYRHGGTKPIKTLVDPYASGPHACAVDKITGDLAVTDYSVGVLIYAHASGSPVLYGNDRFSGYNFAGYDDRGNLLVDGYGDGAPQFAELLKGGGTLTSITLNANLVQSSGIAWDGKYFAICDPGQQPNVVDAFSLSGSTGTLKRTVTLDDSISLVGIAISPFGYPRRDFGSKEIIAADFNDDARKGYVWYWSYPKGGTPVKMIIKQAREPVGVAVSKGGL